MIHLRKFCACGIKLERVVTDETAARTVIEYFRFEHSGAGHGPITGHQYLKLVQSIIRRNAARKGKADLRDPRLRVFQVIRGGGK
ncbi:MAG: hypothetical protein WBV94_06930 [Blastocatellia bacterium]